MWKLSALTVGSLLGFILLVAVPWLRVDASQGERLSYAALGTMFAGGGLAVALFTIRCPACRANWMARAARQPSAQWLRWLVSLQRCPQCGSDGR